MPAFEPDNPTHLKAAATAVTAPPIAILLLFTFGEVIGGDISGVQHLAQLLPLAIVLAAAWRFPRVGGAALVALSLVLGVVYPFAFAGADLGTIILVELLLFVPPMLAGLLFLVAARASSRAQRQASSA
jgi:hypothetical protein